MNELKQKLEEDGWKDREGFFYRTDKPYNLRVISTFDRSFARYTQFVEDYPNIHYPRFMDVKEVKDMNPTMYIYQMENLYQPKNTDYFKYLVEAVDEVRKGLHHSVTKFYEYYTRNLSIPEPEGSRSILSQTSIDYPKVLAYLKTHESLVTALDNLANQNSTPLSMTEENFKMRFDGTIVITNPFSISMRRGKRDY